MKPEVKSTAAGFLQGVSFYRAEQVSAHVLSWDTRHWGCCAAGQTDVEETLQLKQVKQNHVWDIGWDIATTEPTQEQICFLIHYLSPLILCRVTRGL